MEFDEKETVVGIKKHILASRRNKTYEEAEARTIWDELEHCKTLADVYELPIDDIRTMLCYRNKPCIDWFWSLWQKFSTFVQAKIEENVATFSNAS